MKKQKRKNTVIFAVGILVVLLVALGLVFLQGNKNLLDPQQITSVLLTEEESGIEQKLDPQQTEQLAQMVNVALKQKGSDFSGEQAKEEIYRFWSVLSGLQMYSIALLTVVLIPWIFVTAIFFPLTPLYRPGPLGKLYWYCLYDG